MTLIPLVAAFFKLFDGLNLIYFTPYVSLVLSAVGLVTALSRDKRFICCVFCLGLTILEMLVPAYMSRPRSYPEPQIMTRGLSPEESVSIESVNEEINRALYGNAITRSTK